MEINISIVLLCIILQLIYIISLINLYRLKPVTIQITLIKYLYRFKNVNKFFFQFLSYCKIMKIAYWLWRWSKRWHRETRRYSHRAARSHARTRTRQRRDWQRDDVTHARNSHRHAAPLSTPAPHRATLVKLPTNISLTKCKKENINT